MDKKNVTIHVDFKTKTVTKREEFPLKVWECQFCNKTHQDTTDGLGTCIPCFLGYNVENA